MKTNMSLQTVQFLADSLDLIQEQLDFAYPDTEFDASNAHSALCGIQGIVKILQAFTNNLEGEI